MAYGLLAAGIAFIKYPVQWDTGLLLSILFVLYGGIKAAVIGFAVWMLFAVTRRVRGRLRQSHHTKE